MMDKLKEGIEWLNGVMDALECCDEDTSDEVENLEAVRDALIEFVESTAYIVSKCPKCGSGDNVEYADGDMPIIEGDLDKDGDLFISTYLHCFSSNCNHVVGPFKTAKEAAAAFGRKD